MIDFVVDAEKLIIHSGECTSEVEPSAPNYSIDICPYPSRLKFISALAGYCFASLGGFIPFYSGSVIGREATLEVVHIYLGTPILPPANVVERGVVLLGPRGEPAGLIIICCRAILL